MAKRSVAAALCEQGGRHLTCCLLCAAIYLLDTPSFREIRLLIFTHPPLPIKQIDDKQCRPKGTVLQEGFTRSSRARLGQAPLGQEIAAPSVQRQQMAELGKSNEAQAQVTAVQR